MTSPITRRRRIVALAAVGAGLALTPVAAMAASASPTINAPMATAAATTTTVKAKTTTTTTPTTTRTYEVIAGTFTTKAAADKRLAAITAAKIKGLTEVKIGKTVTRYRIEDKPLTKVAAQAKVKELHTAKFFAYFVIN